MGVPSFMLKKMYQKGTLATEGDGFRFEIKNHLAKATFTEPVTILVDGDAVEGANVTFDTGEEKISPSDVNAENPFVFGKGDHVTVHITQGLDEGMHKLAVVGQSKEWGEIKVEVEDKL